MTDLNLATRNFILQSLRSCQLHADGIFQAQVLLAVQTARRHQLTRQLLQQVDGMKIPLRPIKPSGSVNGQSNAAAPSASSSTTSNSPALFQLPPSIDFLRYWCCRLSFSMVSGFSDNLKALYMDPDTNHDAHTLIDQHLTTAVIGLANHPSKPLNQADCLRDINFDEKDKNHEYHHAMITVNAYSPMVHGHQVHVPISSSSTAAASSVASSVSPFDGSSLPSYMIGGRAGRISLTFTTNRLFGEEVTERLLLRIESPEYVSISETGEEKQESAIYAIVTSYKRHVLSDSKPKTTEQMSHLQPFLEVVKLPSALFFEMLTRIADSESMSLTSSARAHLQHFIDSYLHLYEGGPDPDKKHRRERKSKKSRRQEDEEESKEGDADRDAVMHSSDEEDARPATKRRRKKRSKSSKRSPFIDDMAAEGSEDDSENDPDQASQSDDDDDHHSDDDEDDNEEEDEDSESLQDFVVDDHLPIEDHDSSASEMEEHKSARRKSTKSKSKSKSKAPASPPPTAAKKSGRLLKPTNAVDDDAKDTEMTDASPALATTAEPSPSPTNGNRKRKRIAEDEDAQVETEADGTDKENDQATTSTAHHHAATHPASSSSGSDSDSEGDAKAAPASKSPKSTPQLAPQTTPTAVSTAATKPKSIKSTPQLTPTPSPPVKSPKLEPLAAGSPTAVLKQAEMSRKARRAQAKAEAKLAQRTNKLESLTNTSVNEHPTPTENEDDTESSPQPSQQVTQPFAPTVDDDEPPAPAAMESTSKKHKKDKNKNSIDDEEPSPSIAAPAALSSPVVKSETHHPKKKQKTQATTEPINGASNVHKTNGDHEADSDDEYKLPLFHDKSFEQLIGGKVRTTDAKSKPPQVISTHETTPNNTVSSWPKTFGDKSKDKKANKLKSPLPSPMKNSQQSEASQQKKLAKEKKLAERLKAQSTATAAASASPPPSSEAATLNALMDLDADNIAAPTLVAPLASSKPTSILQMKSSANTKSTANPNAATHSAAVASSKKKPLASPSIFSQSPKIVSPSSNHSDDDEEEEIDMTKGATNITRSPGKKSTTANNSHKKKKK